MAFSRAKIAGSIIVPESFSICGRVWSTFGCFVVPTAGVVSSGVGLVVGWLDTSRCCVNMFLSFIIGSFHQDDAVVHRFAGCLSGVLMIVSGDDCCGIGFAF